ncbi:MAG TPA: phenylacetate-CoA oxygenase subunit PaaJ [Actinobacteria bacterium]|nr:phenylacetate-CoA oxygenase subunit PaaJ [Actinomycetota bacterium]
MVTATAARVREILDAVVDPEIPVLTIADLGILRDVAVDDDGRVVVTITPTYSGCPAMDLIREEVERALAAHGYHDVEVRTTFSPPWSTDLMSEEAKEKLRAYGIAPPRSGDDEPIRCPRCGEPSTRTVARFGSTACKALMVCERCLEPFDHFKEL